MILLKRYGRTWLDFRKDGLALPGTVIQFRTGKLKILGDLNLHGRPDAGCGPCTGALDTECPQCRTPIYESCTYPGCRHSELRPDTIIAAYAVGGSEVRSRWIVGWFFMAGAAAVGLAGGIWELLG